MSAAKPWKWIPGDRIDFRTDKIYNDATSWAISKGGVSNEESHSKEIKMKAIKMLGLAALTALMAMAFVGATSAMAESTALCSEDTTEDCETLSHVHETSVGKAQLLTSIGTIECNVLYLGDVSSAGSPLVIKGKFTYTNCVLGGSSCTATEEKGPSEIKVLKEGHETASVTGEGLVHVVCSGFIDCSYNGTGLKSTAKGPLLSTQKNGEVTLSEQSTTKEAGGFLCPKTAKLDITTTPLEATYINGGLVYCAETETTNGIYTDNTCHTLGSTPATYEYEYALVVTSGNPKVNEVRCSAAPNSLWNTRVLGECKEDRSRSSPFEKETVKTVD